MQLKRLHNHKIRVISKQRRSSVLFWEVIRFANSVYRICWVFSSRYKYKRLCKTMSKEELTIRRCSHNLHLIFCSYEKQNQSVSGKNFILHGTTRSLTKKFTKESFALFTKKSSTPLHEVFLVCPLPQYFLYFSSRSQSTKFFAFSLTVTMSPYWRKNEN